MAASKKPALRKIIVLSLKAAATAVAIWLILRQIDLSAAWAQIVAASPALLLAGFGLLLAQVAVNGIRWSALARSSGMNLPPRRAIRGFHESLFFGQFTPSGLGGDAWRVYSVKDVSPSIAHAMHSVVMDRVIGAAALILLVFIGTAISLATGKVVEKNALLVGAAIAGVLCAGVAGAFTFTRLPERFLNYDRFGAGESIRRMSHLVIAVVRKPTLLAATFGLSLAGHVLCASSVWVFARALGFDPGLAACLVIVPLAVLISMAPITIAGWGLREGVIAAGFFRAGVELEVAGALSLVFGLALASIGLTGGAMLWLSRRQPNRIAATSETTSDSALPNCAKARPDNS